MSDDEVSRLFRVSRTVHEMVFDRGYAVSREERELSLDDFKAQFAPVGNYVECARSLFLHGRIIPDNKYSKGKLNFFAAKADDPNERIYVFYSPEKSVGIKTMRAWVL